MRGRSHRTDKTTENYGSLLDLLSGGTLISSPGKMCNRDNRDNRDNRVQWAILFSERRERSQIFFLIFSFYPIIPIIPIMRKERDHDRWLWQQSKQEARPLLSSALPFSPPRKCVDSPRGTRRAQPRLERNLLAHPKYAGL